MWIQVKINKNISETNIKGIVLLLLFFITQSLWGLMVSIFQTSSEYGTASSLQMCWTKLYQLRNNLKKHFLQKKRSTASCFVRQTANLDYTEPEFEISIRAEDDRSLVRLLLNIGTVPGGSDVLHEFELGGPSTIVREVSYSWGFPCNFNKKKIYIYFLNHQTQVLS